MAGWLAGAISAEGDILDFWKDAPVESLPLLRMLLDVARQQVVAFAPEGEPEEQVSELLTCLGYGEDVIANVLAVLELEPPADPPQRYVYAQVQQAKNLFNAGRVANDGSTGAEGFTFTPRPLDKTIRAIIRPQSGGRDVL